jgi:hypothetical protein
MYDCVTADRSIGLSLSLLNHDRCSQPFYLEATPCLTRSRASA